MSFPKYPEYKDSGLECLGEVPTHWDVKQLRHCLQDSCGLKIGPFGSQLTSDMLLPEGFKVYGQENVIAKDFVRGERFISSDKFSEMDVYKIEEGDILVTMMGSSGRCAVVPKNIEAGIMDSHLLRIKINDKAFVEYVAILLSESKYVQYQFQCLGKGSIMHGLNSSIIKQVIIAQPPLEEQSAIAAFLDRETAKIDALVAEQEKLIELLKEKRQAVISHAVTKGLDPNVPMKDSGVEWLGEVPEHWSTGHVRKFAHLESGHTPSRQRPEYWENCTIPWFSLTDVWQIRDGLSRYVTETAERVSDLGLANSSARLLPKGTVILSRTASVGFSAIMGRDMATTQDFANWICKENLIPEFLLYIFKGMKSEFDRLMMGSTHKTIYMPDISKFAMGLPPVSEQISIINFLDQETLKADKLIEESQRAIDLLKERRSALISAAVTGKIDVREKV